MANRKPAKAAEDSDVVAREAQLIDELAEGFTIDDHRKCTGTLRNAVVDILRRWGNYETLNEQQQRDVHASVSTFASDLVRSIAHTIASQGRQEFQCKLEKFVVKDGLQLTLKAEMPDDEMFGVLAHAQGFHVLLAFPNAEDFDGGDRPAITPDQPAMFPDDSSDLANASDRIVSRDDDGNLTVKDAEGNDLGEPTEAERARFEFGEDNPDVVIPEGQAEAEAEA